MLDNILKKDPVINALNQPIKREVWSNGLPERVYDKFNGVCKHCKEKLPDKEIKPRQYDIDHHPIPYRDIADNSCPSFCLKVNDPMDENNLIPAHIKCNRSGNFELNGKFYYCNKTQCFCPKRKACCSVWVLIFLGIGFGLGLLIYKFCL